MFKGQLIEEMIAENVGAEPYNVDRFLVRAFSVYSRGHAVR
jgi:hypothetical protein